MLPLRDEVITIEKTTISCSPSTAWLYLSIEFLIGLAIFLFVNILGIIKSLLPKPPRDLTGNVVLITGAATSLGSSLTKEFARNGCSVVCVDELDDTVEEIKTQRKCARRSAIEEVQVTHGKHKNADQPEKRTVLGYRCDLLNRDEIRKTAGRIGHEIGGIDILVTCVGNSGEDVFDTANATLMSHYWTVMAFLPLMLHRERAYVVGITPIASDDDAYISTRAAIAGLMESLGHELSNRDSHFTVLAVAPTANSRFLKESEQRVARDVVEAVRRDQSSLTVSWISRFFYAISCIIYDAITTITQWLHTQGCDYTS